MPHKPRESASSELTRATRPVLPWRSSASGPHCPDTRASLPRDVVLFSTADWDHPFWTNKQRVACELAKAGFRVLYVESLGLRRPTAGPRDMARILRRLRRAAPIPRKVADNIWVCSPLVLPWHTHGGIRAFNQRWLAWLLRRMIGRLGFQQPLLWTYNPLMGPLLRQLPGSLKIYHCVDDLTAAPHMPAATIESAETELAQSADLIFTTSPRLQDRMTARHATTSHYLPNVADYEHFARARCDGPTPSDLAGIPQPRIGFIGAVSSYKVDFDLIATVAKAKPNWHWVLIGQVGEGEPGTSIAALRLPNVHLLGPRPYEELPDYLRGFDLAAIPSVANDYTASMFPLKFFEYLAAGQPVVAANVPALAEYADACKLVNGADGFLRAVEQTLAGDVAPADERDVLAREFTWQRRTEQMIELLQEAWASKCAAQAPPHDAS